LLGHGQTAAPPEVEPYHIENAARDLIALLDALAIPRVTLLGYSMGGRLALFTALTYPDRVRALVLESASPGLATATERAARIQSDEALAAQIIQNGIVWFADYWGALPLFATQSVAVQATLRSVRLSQSPNGLANSLRGMGTGAQPSLWDRLGELTAPTLLITGASDAKFTPIAERMRAAIPTPTAITTWTAPNAGHTVHQEQSSAYLRTLRDWLHALASP
jgi:2-succinyl-6-hydroxy-2,4-cyclohexadiene-1-carboxylate synthase